MGWAPIAEVHMVGVLHGANLQTVEISQSLQFGVGGGQAVSSVLQHAHELESGVVEGLAQLGVEVGVAVEHLVDGRAVILSKDHGQVEHGSLRDEGHGGSDLADPEGDVVALNLTQQINVGAQIAVGVIVDGQLAAGDLSHLLSDQLTEQLSGSAHAGGVSTNQFDGLQIGIGAGGGSGSAGAGIRAGRLLGAGAIASATGGQRQGHGHGQKCSKCLFHCFSSLTTSSFLTYFVPPDLCTDRGRGRNKRSNLYTGAGLCAEQAHQ